MRVGRLCLPSLDIEAEPGNEEIGDFPLIPARRPPTSPLGKGRVRTRDLPKFPLPDTGRGEGVRLEKNLPLEGRGG